MRSVERLRDSVVWDWGVPKKFYTVEEVIKRFGIEFKVIESEEELKRIFSERKNEFMIGIDVETKFLTIWDILELSKEEILDRFISIQFAFSDKKNKGYIIFEKKLFFKFIDLLKEYNEKIKSYLFYNASYDLAFLNFLGLERKYYFKKLEDISLLIKLYSMNTRCMSLKTAVKLILAWDLEEFKDIMSLVKLNKYKDERFIRYACFDVISLFYLRDRVYPYIRLWECENAYKLNSVLTEVIKEMMMRRIGIDKNLVKSILDKLEMRLKWLEENIFKIAGRRFKLGNAITDEVRYVIFNVLKIKPIAYTEKEKKPALNKKVLERMKDEHIILKYLAEYYDIKAKINKYLKVLLTIKNDYIYSNYHLCVSSTGRISSSKSDERPDLVPLPAQTFIKPKAY